MGQAAGAGAGAARAGVPDEAATGPMLGKGSELEKAPSSWGYIGFLCITIGENYPQMEYLMMIMMSISWRKWQYDQSCDIWFCLNMADSQQLQFL